MSNSKIQTNRLIAHSSKLKALLVFIVFITLSWFSLQSANATAGQIIKMVTSDGGSTFYVGRCFRMNIRVQTDSLNANSVDVIIPYNSTYVQPYSDSSCTTAADVNSAVQTDGLFPSYPYNKIVDSKIKITAYDQTNASPVNTGAAPSDSLLAHVWWKVMSASGAFNLRFEFTPGSTTDTNMAQQNGDGSDVLDSVENLSLVLASDTSKPTFSNLSPAASATTVSVTTGVTYTFSDSGAGIDTSSLTNKLSGTSKSLSTSGCTTTNSNRTSSCNITMSSVGTLSYYTWYVVAATGSDLASPTTNSASQAWWFRTEDDTDAPYLGSLSPASSATGVAVGSNIVFHVKDYKGQAGVTPGLGVDISTVQVTVTPAGGSPIVYNYSSSQFGYTGTSADYTVTINPTSDFSQNTVVSVAVNASDSNPRSANVMSTSTYSFRTADSSAPTFSGFSPAQSATGVAPDANVVFHILDTGTGVDLTNTTVTVAGTSYTKTGSPSYSYTGTAADYTITVNPSGNFTGGQVVTVSISTRDLDSNTATTSYSFTVRNACTTCSVDTEDPARFTTSATLDATISFHVKDTGSGIRQSSIKATLTGTGSAFTATPLVLTGASALVSITGTAADYTVTITLPAAIQQNKTYSILIEATDTDSVPMDDVAYSFANIVTTTTTVASSCTTTTATTGTTHGGGRRDIADTIANLESADLPVIVARRRLPGTLAVVSEELPPEVARKVNRCYVDEAEATHAAALAQKTKYRDVPAGIWYEDAVAAFLKRGILDAAKEYFRGGAPAARAEVAKVLSKIRDASPQPLPEILAFDDADRAQWYAPFVEFSAQNGWMRGYGDCAGTHPCFVRPGSTITRAEAVAMIVRFFDLQPLSLAPRFTDVPEDAWYAGTMRSAADRCIVQGDAVSHRAHPAALLTRAELIVLLYRAEQQLRYGTDCSWGETRPQDIANPKAPESVPAPSSSSASASTPPPIVAPALPIEARGPSSSAEALPARTSLSGWPAKASLLTPSASSSVNSSMFSSQAAVTSAASPKSAGMIVLVFVIAGVIAAVVVGRMLL